MSASYAPELTGIGPYSAELAEALARRGHEVRAICSFPFYPEWIPRVPAGTLLYRTESLDRVLVTRCRTYVPSHPGTLRRVLHEVSWVGSAFPAAVRLIRWAEAWIVISPAFGSALIGACLARFTSSRVHIHVQDVVPDVAVESGQVTSQFLLRCATAVARWTYGSFGSASVLSESMADRFRRYASGTVRIAVAPNWIRNTDELSDSLPVALRGRPYAVYAGSFGRKQDLALLIEAASLLAARHGPTIAVLGDGPGRDALDRAGEGIVWLGLVDVSTYRTVLEHALAGIVALAPGVGDSVVPSKLAAYLGAGRPVVVAAELKSEAARVVGAAGCGVRIPPGRADLLADSLLHLARDRRMCHEYGASGLAYAQAHWSKETIVNTIEGALRAL